QLNIKHHVTALAGFTMFPRVQCVPLLYFLQALHGPPLALKMSDGECDFFCFFRCC
ncbi:hypothetical protein CRUP_014468, partial [Coryphaenoides rupestris]